MPAVGKIVYENQDISAIKVSNVIDFLFCEIHNPLKIKIS